CTARSPLSLHDALPISREVDAGLETIEVDLPAVFTADLRLNEPRYVKLPEIMKAKKKPLDTLALADLGVDTTPQFRTLKYEPPRSEEHTSELQSRENLV